MQPAVLQITTYPPTMKNNLKINSMIPAKKKKEIKTPLYLTNISAGFPSPCDDYIEKKLDLNEHLVKNPAATFFVRVEGDSMVDCSIQSGDTLIVDRSLEVKNGSIVVAMIDGEFTVKKIKKSAGAIYLLPQSKDFHYKPVKITSSMNFEVWGIVTNVIHSLK